MKKHIIVAVLAALAFSIVFAVLDAIFRDSRPFMFYFGGGVLFGLFSGFIHYMEDKHKNKKNNT